jgi:hypothetical protein
LLHFSSTKNGLRPRSRLRPNRAYQLSREYSEDSDTFFFNTLSVHPSCINSYYQTLVQLFIKLIRTFTSAAFQCILLHLTACRPYTFKEYSLFASQYIGATPSIATKQSAAASAAGNQATAVEPFETVSS